VFWADITSGNKKIKKIATIYIQIENLKCAGCAAMIKKGLLSLENIGGVGIDIEKSIVPFTSIKDNSAEVKEKLSKQAIQKLASKKLFYIIFQAPRINLEF
jgi:copper chaperone CopZ